VINEIYEKDFIHFGYKMYVNIDDFILS
jgi:hypothetical protein